MGAPALGIGQFLAAALGTMAVGGLSGMAQMKMKENADAKAFTMQLIQKALFDKMMGGVDIPDETLKLAVGGNAELFKQVKPAVAGLSQMMRQQRAEGMANVFVGQPGASAPTGEAPGLAPTPSAAPQAGAILGAMSGAQQAPPQAAPPILAQAPSPSVPPATSTEPGAPQPGQLRPGIKSFTRQVPGIGTAIYESGDEQRKASVLKWGIESGASPKAINAQLTKQKLPMLSQAEYTQIGETWTATHLPAALARVVEGGGVAGPEATQQALIRLYGESGYLPAQLITQAVPDQTSRDAWFARLDASNGGRTPLAKLFEAAAILGIPVSPEQRKQSTEAATARATAAALSADPTLRGNPSALARAVWEALGYSAQSPEATALMNQLAPVSAQTAEQLTMQGKAQPLAANVGAPPAPAGAPTGETGVTSGLDVAAAKRSAEITAAREAEHLAAAREVGKAKGEETARTITTVNDEKTLMQLVDRQGNPAPPGMTQKELDAKIADGTYGRLGIDRKVYVGFQQVNRTLDLYAPILSRPGNVFQRGVWARVASQFAGGPWKIGLAGFDKEWEMPPVTVLRDRLKLTPQDISDIQQIVTIRNLGAAHIRALDEKGQGMTAKLYQAGIRSFPGLMDDYASADAKIAAFRAIVNTRLDEAVSWTTPKVGVPSTYKGWTITPGVR